MRDRSSALEASERSIRESISRGRECEGARLGFRREEDKAICGGGKPRREPSVSNNRNFFLNNLKVELFFFASQ